jgi:hypothetical protein
LLLSRAAAGRIAPVLDANGDSAGQAELVKTGQRVQLAFPEDAMYVVLQQAI